LTIIFPAHKDWFQILFMAVWLLIWLGMGIGLVSILVTVIGGATGVLGPASVGARTTLVITACFLLVFLAIWLSFGALVVYGFLWRLVGKDIIEVSNWSLVVSREVAGLRRSKTYLADRVKNLRLERSGYEHDFPIYRNIRRLLAAYGRIAFDYEAKTFRFGSDIDEAEANQLIAAIQQRFPQYRST
jgi:hypothetical protein